MVQKNSNQKAGATLHQPHSRDIDRNNAGFGEGGFEFGDVNYQVTKSFKIYVYAHMHVRGTYLHMNMPERVHDGGNTGGQNLQILKCDR